MSLEPTSTQETEALHAAGGAKDSAPAALTYAVVMKAYAWDAFIKRQARRCAASARAGDFFVSLDETRGRFGPIATPSVLRTSQQAMLGMGLADRYEAGSLLWWNADYAHYDFLERQPQYDYYVFVEYDALFTGDLDQLVTELAAAEVDFAAFPLRDSKTDWHWTKPHLNVYTLEEIEGCLMCISVFSRRALEVLYRRRLEMSSQTDLRYWPSAEAFLPTESKRAGLKFHSLAGFGNITHFDWQPPCLEQVALGVAAPAFVHPVYDRKRYVRWAIEKGMTLQSLLDPNSPVLSTRSQLGKRAYLPLYADAAAKLLWRAGARRTVQKVT